MLNFTALLLLLTTASMASAAEPRFARAIMDTPVLNRADFRAVFGGRDGSTVQTDSCGQPRAVEYIAPQGTLFRIEEVLPAQGAAILRVTTNDYPCPAKSGCYIDARSVKLYSTPPAERPRILPPREQILAALEEKAGTRYIWGGNVAAGIKKLTEWYPPVGAVDKGLWQLAGLDCSGLLYEATGGFTPRNTSELVTYGKGVRIADRSATEVAAALRPLDLIVWPGHVMIVLDHGRVIESRLVCGKPDEGVRIRPLGEVLQDLLRTKKGVDSPARKGKEFSIRRWYDSAAKP
ncbi:MAG: NlpC/P60 family protein [Geobacter sp.]|nr:NlpC/P60 family protein [Geobacter sp.]